MDNKRKFSLTLFITMFLLIALVSVATYAYFSASISTNNVTYINTTTASGVASFTALGDSAIINVTSGMMLERETSAVNAIASNNATIKAVLKGVSTSLVYCTYDLMFAWDSSGDSYTSSAGLNSAQKEFSIQIDSTCKVNGVDCSTAIVDNDLTDEITLNMKNPTLTETQISNTTPYKLADGKIYTMSSTNDTVVASKVTLRVYNVPGIDQSDALSGNTFKAKIYIDNVNC